MHRRPGRAPSGPACVAVLITSLVFCGCGGALAPAARPSAPGVLAGRPVADLSGWSPYNANFFMGVAASYVRPEGSSLDSAWAYDLNMAFDVSRLLTLEVLIGKWDIPDRPLAEADSDLEMVPILVSLQLQKEFAKFRAYGAVGGGYSFNNYALGGAHRQAILDQGLTTYSADAADGVLGQAAVGAEFYSSETADLNFGVELRYVLGDVDVEENRDGVPATKTAGLDLWLLRFGVTWHF